MLTWALFPFLWQSGHYTELLNLPLLLGPLVWHVKLKKVLAAGREHCSLMPLFLSRRTQLLIPDVRLLSQFWPYSHMQEIQHTVISFSDGKWTMHAVKSQISPLSSRISLHYLKGSNPTSWFYSTNCYKLLPRPLSRDIVMIFLQNVCGVST